MNLKKQEVEEPVIAKPKRMFTRRMSVSTEDLKEFEALNERDDKHFILTLEKIKDYLKGKLLMGNAFARPLRKHLYVVSGSNRY